MPPSDAAEDYHDDMKTLDAKRVLEAALICSAQPTPLREPERTLVHWLSRLCDTLA